MTEFFMTKVTLTVEVSTQFGPDSAVQLTQTRLQCPAVKGIEIKSVESNYRLHQTPDSVFRPFSLVNGQWVLSEDA